MAAPTPFSSPLQNQLQRQQDVFAQTEVTGSPSTMVTEWFKPESEGTRLPFSDDVCNSDADLLGDNSDPGDPRDGVTSATGALVSASQNDPGPHQVETGGDRGVRIIGPHGPSWA